jgi:uroporphyrinogen decarboxylase
MTHRERFYCTIERKPVDRPATWIGEPVSSAVPGLARHFGVQDLAGVKSLLEDDVYHVNVPYESPVSSHVAAAFDFAKKETIDYENRTLTAPGFFEDYDDPADVARFPWPDPREHIDADACRRVVDEQPEDAAVLGLLWAAHFQDACAAFGMETALVTMIENPGMFDAVIGRILEFYLEAGEIFYRNTEGRLDAVLIGNDFGSQTGLMLSPALIREHVFDGTRRLIEQAHSYGVKVIHHSCGAIHPIIPDLIDLGADAIHPMQALARDMSAERLSADFGDRVSFCGGLDAQELLVHGTPEMVAARVRELWEIFPTGLIISPSHEAILPDTPPENVAAMFEAAGNTTGA